MKKLFLLFGLSVLSLTLMARERPFVEVHKHDGGLQAILNCYNYVDYTPSMDETIPSTLECYGAGWSFCRFPRLALPMENCPSHLNTPGAILAIINAMNEILELSEQALVQKGVTSGSKSITLSIPNTLNRGRNMCAVRGEWAYKKNGDGTVKFYVNPLTVIGIK